MPTILVVGLPSSGKSTYLAALHWALQHSDAEAPLRLDRRSGDTTYIDELTRRWSAATPVNETTAGAPHPVCWHVIDASGTELAVSAPDISGETYASAWADRGWHSTVDRLVRTCDAILLFLSAQLRYLPLTLDELNQVSQALPSTDADDRVETDVPPASEATSLEWTPDVANPLVKVVDLLQMMKPDRPVCVIVSAWDLVADPELSPDRWLEAACPLLSQRVADSTDVAVFGVSAQGGDYRDPAALAKIRSTEPSVRPIVLAGDGSAATTGVIAPLSWALRAAAAANA